MRKDMSKVIVERARIKQRNAVKGRKHRHREDIFDLPAKISMKKSAGWGRKSLNENLAPLRRFLESRAGRPWDRVYSELCENIRITSAVQLHIRQHLPDLIALQPIFDEKKVYNRRWGRNRELRHGELYVDAKGFLRKYVTRKPKKPVRENPIEKALNKLLALVDSKILFEGDSVFSLVKDRETGGWHSKSRANKTHARIAAAKVLASVDSSMIAEFLRQHAELKKSTSEYLASLYRHLEEGLEEREAVEAD